MLRGTSQLLCKQLTSAVCALALLCFAMTAQAGSKQTLRFTHITKEHGLQDGSIPAIYQDKQGLMWIGTASGLARYDGRHMRRWGADPEDPHSLSNPLVTALIEGKNQELWIGTAAGLDKLNLQTEQIERITMPNTMSLQQRRIWALAPSIDEKIWIASQFTLLRFDPKASANQQFTTIPLQGEKGALIRSLISDQAGGAWAAVGSHISHINAQGVVVQAFDTASLGPHSPKVNFSVRSMTLDHQNKLWIGMHGGLQVWDVSAETPIPDPIVDRLQLKKGRIFAMFMDEEKSIWIGYGDDQALVRVRRLPSEEVETFNNYPALPSSIGGNSIASLFQDRSGTLWVGTWGMGVSLVDLRKKGFTSYVHLAEEPRSLSNNNVLALSMEDEENLWIGTYGGGLNRLNLKTGNAELIPNSVTGSRNIKALLRKTAREMWIGGDEGLKVLNLQTKKLRTIPLVLDTPGAGSISSIILDHQGDVWAGSAAGLYRINSRFELKTYKAHASTAGSLTHDTVDCLLEDKEHNLWIGSKGGLQRWDHQTHSFSQPIKPTADLKNPAGLSIYGLHQDDQDRIWVGTSVGLFQLIRNNDQWQLHSWRNTKGMPEGWVITIQHDQQGDLWLGGEQGLVHLKLNQNQAKLYTNKDGPIDGSFSFGANAKLHDGRLLFGAVGLLSFDPKELKENDTPVQVILSDILEFNRSLSRIDQQTEGDADKPSTSLADLGIKGLVRNAASVYLSPKQSMISFEFAPLQFYFNKNNRLAWKLEGFDKDWIYSKAGEGLATYTNLDQGHYILRVKASNSAGMWNEDALQLQVYVSPPFWKSWWFLSMLACAIATILIAAYRMRVKFLQANQIKLENLVAQRTQEVLEQKDQLKVEKEIAERERELADKARHNILLLSEIGREISASLDIKTIQNIFYTHVAKLMDADVYGIGMVDWEKRTVNFDSIMDHGVPAEPFYRSLDDQQQPSARCVMQKTEVLIEKLDFDINFILDPDQQMREAKRVDGSPVSIAKSALYIPLIVSDEVIGVITVLSVRENAYQSTHLDMLRTLGAYAAVALDKAAAYEHLQQTQSKLVEQEKLAALGSIVAGVAHELNTPIGNSLLVASTLKERNDEFLRSVQSGSLKRSEMEKYCLSSTEAMEIILRNLDTSAQLVSSFKQISTDQTSNQKREFNLYKLIEEISMTLAARIRREQHQLVIDIPPDIQMQSYPGALGQVLSNLIINAVIHGFDGKPGGEIRISAKMIGPQKIRLAVKDNGKGIASKNLNRIFEPFFTTRLGQGGSGLGLHISYNIISSVLGGAITVHSLEGEGTTFELELPLKAPALQDSAIDESGKPRST